jgi:drug/metabolite transporter (DMT)-like permease
VFFLSAFAAAFGYALQMTLLASFYRKMDTLAAVAYRGLSLGLTMLPLLWWVPAQDFTRLAAVLPQLGLIWLLTALGNWTIANAVCHLPVGVATALCNGFIAIMAAIVGFVLFQEILSVRQVVMIAAILLTVFGLGWSRSPAGAVISYNITAGLRNALLSGLFLGISFSLVGGLSRQIHPFLIGYAWELGTGGIAWLWMQSRAQMTARGASSTISLGEFGRVMLAGSPTLVGTGLYALSMTMGPVAIATAVISTQMVFTTLLARLLYKERLTVLQWLLLAAVCVGVMALKMVS